MTSRKILSVRSGWFLASVILGTFIIWLVKASFSSANAEHWRPPVDLQEKQGQLTELTIPVEVDRSNWISSHIKILNIAEGRMASLEGLPRSLKKLDIRHSTQLQDLGGLPPGLEVLKISGSGIVSLGAALPSSLLELHLQDTSIKDLSGLPSSLRTIVLRGASFYSLDGLPPRLRSLTLHGTKVRSLRGLPERLQKLVLVANSDLRFEAGDLPPHLAYLVIDDQDAPAWDRVPYLCALSDRRLLPVGPWPKFLSSLTLRATNLTELPDLPPAIRALGLLHSSLSNFDGIPPRLEILDLTGYRNAEIGDLPKGLRSLKLSDSSVARLPMLPENLEELDISNTGITKLPPLPSRLKTLAFHGARQINIEEIRRLDVLERLDLTGANLRNLGVLPPNLRSLCLRDARIRGLSLSRHSHLEELDISGTPLREEFLRELPQKLKSLTLSEGQVKKLGSLPKSIEALHFIGPSQLEE